MLKPWAKLQKIIIFAQNCNRNMNNLAHFVRKYPLSLSCVVIIWVLCFMDVPETPLDGVSFIDKWTHIIMYAGTCSVIWIEYLRCHNRPNVRKPLLWAWFAPVLMSGLIELLQAYCTGGRRSGDWLDFAANAFGATLALCGGTLWVLCRSKR